MHSDCRKNRWTELFPLPLPSSFPSFIPSIRIAPSYPLFFLFFLEVCGYSIFATRPVPVGQDRYPYPYPTRTQNYYPTRPVPAGIPVPVTVQPSQVPMHRLCSYQADRLANRHVVIV